MLLLPHHFPMTKNLSPGDASVISTLLPHYDSPCRSMVHTVTKLVPPGVGASGGHSHVPTLSPSTWCRLW